MNTPTSDEDFKGVAIPPRSYFLGFAGHFEQAESNEPDLVIYEVRKFFQLAKDCNPNLVEWAAEQDRAMQALYESSTLPHAPDTEKLDALCIRLVEGML